MAEKKILTVGLLLASDQAEHAHFYSKNSLLDLGYCSFSTRHQRVDVAQQRFTRERPRSATVVHFPLLHEKGFRVFAVQLPLTSLSEDIDRTSKLAAAQDAPILAAQSSLERATRQMSSASYIWQGLPSKRGEPSRPCKRVQRHLRGRQISARIGTGFCGSRLRSFTRHSVTTSTIKLNRWYGQLRRNRRRCVASKRNLEHRHGE